MALRGRVGRVPQPLTHARILKQLDARLREGCGIISYYQLRAITKGKTLDPQRSGNNGLAVGCRFDNLYPCTTAGKDWDRNHARLRVEPREVSNETSELDCR